MIFLAALLGGPPLYHLFRFFPVSAVILITTILAVFAYRRKFVVCVLIVMGIAYANVRHHAPALAPGFQGVRKVQGYFSAPATELDEGFSQAFRATGGGYRGPLDVLAGKKFHVGEQYELRLKLYGPGGRVNPGDWLDDPFGVVVGADGPSGEVHNPLVLMNRARDALSENISESMGSDEAGLTAAVTTGQRGGLSHEMHEAFRSAGVAHLLSISGTHFGLIGVLMFGIIRLVLRRLPHNALERLTAYLTPTEAAALATFPFMLFYLGLSGARIPSVRSFMMMSLFMLGFLLGRRGKWVNFVLAAAVLLVYLDPEVMFSLSFQLSFLAVLFIGFAIKGRGYRSIEHPEPIGNEHEDDEEDGEVSPPVWWKRLGTETWKYVKVSLLISVAASVGTAPLVAYHFHYGSVMSPAANLLVTPVVCMVLVPLSLISSVWFLIFGSFPLAPLIEAVAKVSLWLVQWFANVPGASVSIAPMPPAVPLLFYLGSLVWIGFKKRTLIALPLLPVLIWMIISVTAEPPFRVTFLDAGRADAAVAELPDGKTLVFDTGWRGTQVDYYLRYRGLRQIDAVVLSHGLKDHAGGLGRLARRYDIGEVWDSGAIRYDEPLDSLRRRSLSRGVSTEGDGWRAVVLHPYEGFRSNEQNRLKAVSNASLVVRLEGETASVLFPGDIQDEGVHDLLYLGDSLRSSVLKAPHHAMNPKALRKLLGVVEPEAVVITAGKVPKKTKNVVDGQMVWVTGQDGAVKIEERNGKLSMSSFADFRLQEAVDSGREWKNIQRIFRVW